MIKTADRSAECDGDSPVYKVVVHPVQQDLLQQDLQSLEQWENKWDMTFHPEKCVYMPVTRMLRTCSQDLAGNRWKIEGGLHGSIRDWNHLQKETVEAATVEAFVSRAAAEQS
ncbi:Nuclear inhibitor of protein phosphatase 1 [Branchiostoma belcheri]|nr:Nuclear inhibitor of protein phosphatase 1 [Branchiostoma belcheri]